MAVIRSTDNIPALSETLLCLACSLCENEMSDMNDKIQYTFHRECISNWVKSTKECPNC